MTPIHRHASFVDVPARKPRSRALRAWHLAVAACAALTAFSGGSAAAAPQVEGAAGQGQIVFGNGFEGRSSIVDGPSTAAVLAGRWSSVAIGNDGFPVISYMASDATTSFLRVAKCSDARCAGPAQITTVDNQGTDIASTGTSIAIGPDGLPVISYSSRPARSMKVVKCGNAACSSANVITTIDDQTPQDVSTYSSLTIGSDGLPIVSYFNSSLDTLKLVKCGNAACSASNQASTLSGADTVVNSGQNTAIKIGGDGLPIVSYNTSTSLNFTLKTVKCGNLACTSGNVVSTVDDPANSVGDYNAMVIGTDGFPVIAYRDTTALALKVVKCGNATCTSGNTITTVDDSSNSMGVDIAIALAPNGRPVIVHRDLTESQIVMIQCGNSACSAGNLRSVVDAGVDAQELSIAIGTDGLPLVTYYDFDARSLKIAR
jgi:predicted regulator of Ras-like GTPase activity (Roadblock/LC7/MglB family)